MTTQRVFTRIRVFSGPAAIVLVALVALPQLAAAQRSTQQSSGQESLDEVVVTGSRIGRNGFDSPQPLSVVDAEQIENLGLVNVGDVMRTLPQNTPFFTETNVGIGNFNVGAQLANLRGLNPYFGTRTLTLVDTRRVVPNTEGGAVDLTLVPSMLVGRTEVVTGGASAAYGSDAIAGVVNILLDTNLQGFKAQVDLGRTGASDGSDKHASFAWGQGFADDKFHVLVGAEYQHQNAIGPCSQNRGWCREAWAVGNNAFGFNTPAGVGNGYPNFVLGPDSKFPTSENGIIAPCLNAGCSGRGAFQSFNSAGTGLVAYDPGLFGSGFSRIGGDGTVLGYDVSNIRPDTERYSALGHLDINLSAGTTLSFEIANAHSESTNSPANGALGPFGPGVRIQADNAYLGPALQAALPFGGVMNRVFAPDVISANNITEADTTRVVAAIKGDFFSKWKWDGYFQHGSSTYHQQLVHNADLSVLGIPTPYSFFGWAVDAVRSNPLDATSPIVCRATIPGSPTFSPLAAGCVPLNYFGVGNANAAALDYAFRTLKEDSSYKQNVVGVNFRGDVAAGWGAGPISAAVGAEWRSDKSDVTHDMANQPWYSSYLLNWGFDRGGKIEVLEGYGEIQVPIVDTFAADFAVRETHNKATSSQAGVDSQSHNFSSWKTALTYSPSKWLRLRGTRSRDVRGAGFRELFLPRATVTGTPGGFPGGIRNPWNSNIEEAFASTTGGNPDLRPEKADTTALGFVLSFDRLRFSADWYEIDLQGAITPGGTGGLSAQNLVDACFAGGASACGNVGGFGTADITSVEATSINIGDFVTRGVDFEASYDMPVGQTDNLNVRLIASYLYDMIIDTGLGNAAVNYSGQTGPVGAFGGFNTSPDWQATAWLTYSHARFRTTLETRYIAPGALNVQYFESPIGAASNTQPFSINDNSVAGRVYLGWSGSFDFKPREDSTGVQLFWAVTNLLNQDPPVAPGGNFYPTNPVFFDTIGRRFRAGVRVSF